MNLCRIIGHRRHYYEASGVRIDRRGVWVPCVRIRVRRTRCWTSVTPPWPRRSSCWPPRRKEYRMLHDDELGNVNRWIGSSPLQWTEARMRVLIVPTRAGVCTVEVYAGNVAFRVYHRGRWYTALKSMTPLMGDRKLTRLARKLGELAVTEDPR